MCSAEPRSRASVALVSVDHIAVAHIGMAHTAVACTVMACAVPSRGVAPRRSRAVDRTRRARRALSVLRHLVAEIQEARCNLVVVCGTWVWHPCVDVRASIRTDMCVGVRVDMV